VPDGRQFVTILPMDASLYFHIPFCRRRCGYCDFTTFAGFERLIPAYMLALKKQVELFGEEIPVHTIYFGGGTPSLIPANVYSDLFGTIRQRFNVLADAEISLEANPGTVTANSLKEYREAGFNRISFGMQSVREDELRLLDRSHRTVDVTRAMANARTAGFDNINLDLIFGLPGQGLDAWQESLRAAMEFKPEHLSLYSLIVEEGTPLSRQIEAGSIAAPDDDMAAEQYEWTCRFLEDASFDHYEISNWALRQPGRDLRCRHNLQYWRLLPYYGFGCGAVGFLPDGSTRFSRNSSMIMQNEKYIGRYIRQVEDAGAINSVTGFIEPVDADYEMSTCMFTGFRLLEEGINPVEFQRRFNADLDVVFGPRMKTLRDSGLIQTKPDGNIRLTRNAWLVANRVFRKFSGDE
jgi:oxygen-independent coproporphyrinogen III oxidase